MDFMQNLPDLWNPPNFMKSARFHVKSTKFYVKSARFQAWNLLDCMWNLPDFMKFARFQAWNPPDFMKSTKFHEIYQILGLKSAGFYKVCLISWNLLDFMSCIGKCKLQNVNFFKKFITLTILGTNKQFLFCR